MESVQYKPFQPTPESYPNHREQTLARILGAFNDVLGIPTAIIKKEFRGYLEKMVADIHPRYQCSSARAVIENRIPGMVKVIDGLPVTMRGKLNRALALLDILETMVGQSLAVEAKSLTDDAAKEAKRLKEVFGTTKVPCPLPALAENKVALPQKKQGKK